MNDIMLLKILSNAEAFEKYISYIKDHTISKYTKQILSDFKVYFHDLRVKEITPEDFATWFSHVRHVSMNPDRLEAYKIIFNKWQTLLDEDEEHPLEQQIISKFIDLDFFTRIMDISMKGAEGGDTVTIEDVGELVSQYREEAGSVLALDPDKLDDDEVSSSLADVVSSSVLGDGLEWRLEELNVSCGPLRKGDFIEVAAYVDTGKTTFLASEVTHMASQLADDDYAVWVNNEQEGGRVRIRIAQSALGITEGTLMADIPKHDTDIVTTLGKENRIRIKDNPSLSVKELTLYFERVKPKLIVIDLLDKVKGFEDSQRDDIRLGRLYQWAREMAKIYGPVITATQVNGSGAGQKWIYMEQLQGSTVAKQGEADAIITIGRSHDDDGTDPNRRYIHIPKNKLSGGLRTMTSERNGYWEVDILPEVARYKGTL